MKYVFDTSANKALNLSEGIAYDEVFFEIFPYTDRHMKEFVEITKSSYDKIVKNSKLCKEYEFANIEWVQAINDELKKYGL